MKLVVNTSFGGYLQGDEITDEKLIVEILESEQQFYVTKVSSDPVSKSSQPTEKGK